ncbi:F0F1 ATP synthase subunit A [Candidatus Finniella inopinata]|uniref:ATP synthase subunit a n=1 Tax=Candidatus Finniella inopinata TaxID=1696036 RepID=A0A4Q7DIU9_9PROT|nr:F0F1 ATP synthase subunit A [Candidatus Finniella inopinata]RZI46149.1 F0F1 ATP synthase subunit A [Candidatus Finniella inopinata]
MKIDPLSQFSIQSIFPFQVAGVDLSFTNASLFMVATVCLIVSFLFFALRSKQVVPNRLQAAVELLFDFINTLIRSYIGTEGLAYAPLIFCLFLFILGGNLLGLLPHAYTFTSQLVVTFTLAGVVFVSITCLGFAKHGFGFLRLFLPAGTPIYIAPLLVFVEVISYLSRPVSLAVRLFANMVAGHVMLKIFATFAAILAGTSWLGPSALLPTLINVGLFGFEMLVAILQAYVFTILSCIYLNDALHLH